MIVTIVEYQQRLGIADRASNSAQEAAKIWASKNYSDDTSDELIVVSALGVPKDWDAEDVSKFLIAQNWKEIESLQRKSANKRAACWNFRGIPPKDQVKGPWNSMMTPKSSVTFSFICLRRNHGLPNPSKRGLCRHQKGDLLLEISLRKF